MAALLEVEVQSERRGIAAQGLFLQIGPELACDVIVYLLKTAGDMRNIKQIGAGLMLRGIVEDHGELVDMLLAKGISLQDRNEKGITAIDELFAKEEAESLGKLLQKDKTLLGPRDKQRALALAGRLGKLEVLQAVLESGHVDPNQVVPKYRYETSPFMEATRSGNIDCVRLLLQYGGDPEVLINGTLPLIQASDRADVKMVELLLQHGAHVNAQDSEGGTALKYAVGRNNAKLFGCTAQCKSRSECRRCGSPASARCSQIRPRRLCKIIAGCWREDQQKNTRKENALDIAIHHEIGPILALFERYSADFKAVNPRTFIMLAEWGKKELLDLLLHFQYDVNRRADNGNLPLHRAAASGGTYAVGRLLESGARPNELEREEPYPALFHAIQGRHVEIVRLLLEAGASVYVQGPNLDNAIKWAKSLDKSYHEPGAAEEIVEMVLAKRPDGNERIDVAGL